MYTEITARKVAETPETVLRSIFKDYVKDYQIADAVFVDSSYKRVLELVACCLRHRLFSSF